MSIAVSLYTKKYIQKTLISVVDVKIICVTHLAPPDKRKMKSLEACKKIYVNMTKMYNEKIKSPSRNVVLMFINYMFSYGCFELKKNCRPRKFLFYFYILYTMYNIIFIVEVDSRYIATLKNGVFLGDSYLGAHAIEPRKTIIIYTFISRKTCSVSLCIFAAKYLVLSNTYCFIWTLLNHCICNSELNLLNFRNHRFLLLNGKLIEFFS